MRLLGVKYEDVKKLVLEGQPDEAVLAWCRKNGRQIDETDIEIWNSYVTKRGWRDAASDLVVFRVKEAGLEARDMEIASMFDCLDIDEGRTPPDFRKWEPPRFGK